MRYLKRFNESSESNIEILDYIRDILTDITDEGIEYDVYTVSRNGYAYDGMVASKKWFMDNGVNIYDSSMFGEWIYNLSEMSIKSMPDSFFISFESDWDTTESNGDLHRLLKDNKECIERLIGYLNSINYHCYEMTCFSYDNGKNKWTSVTNIDDLLSKSEGEDIAEYQFRFKLDDINI